MRDPYTVLGVSRNASESEIRSAFRALAAKYHPDQNPSPDAADRFKEINAAYQILKDPEKRAQYDLRGAGPGPGAVGGVPMEDVFADILGAFGMRGGRSSDLRATVDVTFEEAALGCEKSVSYERTDNCEDCSGSGGATPHSSVACPACGGNGKVRLGSGLLGMPVPCPQCAGRGRSITDACSRCHGKGVSARRRSLTITLPPGIENGATQIVEGAGNRRSPTSRPGDLELEVKVGSHPLFEREGDDVVSSLRVPWPDAVLGASVMVATLDGAVSLEIPASTQPRTRLKLRGHGVPHRFRSGRGDHLVEVNIAVPKDLSPRARELMTELDATLTRHRGGHGAASEQEPGADGGWFDKLKGLFR